MHLGSEVLLDNSPEWMWPAAMDDGGSVATRHPAFWFRPLWVWTAPLPCGWRPQAYNFGLRWNLSCGNREGRKHQITERKHFCLKPTNESTLRREHRWLVEFTPN